MYQSNLPQKYPKRRAALLTIVVVLVHLAYVRVRRLKAQRPISHRMTAAAAAAFNDSHLARMGIFRVFSHCASSPSDIPRPSLPMTTAQWERSAWRRSTVSSRRAVA